MKKEIIDYFLSKRILLSPDLLDKFNSLDEAKGAYNLVADKIQEDGFLMLTGELIKAAEDKSKIETNWNELDKSKVLYEKGKDDKQYDKFVNYISEEEEQPRQEVVEDNTVKVVYSYEDETKKREVQDFVTFFNSRFDSIGQLLNQRAELQSITSISRIKVKKDKGAVAMIGMIVDMQLTKNENIIMTLEDKTGTIRVVVNKNKPELFEAVKNSVPDEVIGVVGSNSDDIVFANNVIWPEIPMHKELKKSPEEGYAIFLSDIHVGSDNFLEEEFNKFLAWLNCETGNEKQKEIASKVKYAFVVGDLVDGCGIYPGQEDELTIKDIHKQYDRCAEFLERFPKHIKIVICPGNHDAMRIAEPQPPLYRDFCPRLYELSNVTMISNPGIVNIGGKEGFSGFDVLLYHGYSFDYFVNNVDYLRNKGGYNRADLCMKYLLQRRHLAPTHASTLYIPDIRKDPLVITTIPDFFVTGHIHYSIAANYRNISMICCSCWQAKTSFQEKMGHNPQPARVPIVDLQTRAIKILRFGD